jgi:hypothetical protein
MIIDVQEETRTITRCTDFYGRLCSADEVHALSLANLHVEYCTVVTTDTVLRAVDS